MSDSFPNRSIDPELEARIVDMVLGEASAVERERLQALVGDDPQLQAFQREMESVHGLLGHVGKGDSPKRDDDWKLAESKRAELLAVLDGREMAASDFQVTLASKDQQPLLDPNNPAAWRLTRFGVIASSIAAVGLFLVILPSLFLAQRVNRTAYSLSLSTSEDAAAEFVDQSALPPALMEVTEGVQLPNQNRAALDGQAVQGWQAELPSPYYLEDDVQHFPVEGEFKLAEEAERLRKIQLPSVPFSRENKTAGMRGGTNDAYGLSDTLQSTAEPTPQSIPDGGKVLLGGVSREANSSWFGKDPSAVGRGLETESRNAATDTSNGPSSEQSPSIMLGVTPKIVVEQEEEESIVDYLMDVDRSVVVPDTGLALRFSEQRSWEELSRESAASGKAEGDSNSQDISLEKTQKLLEGRYLKEGPVLYPGDQEWSQLSMRRPSLHERTRKGATAKSDVKDGQSVEVSEHPLPTSQPAVEELAASAEPFSTFSLHVSDVSFKLAEGALARGEWPDKSKIRIEEFINAFDYGDPLPHDGQAVSCTLEQALHPFLQRRNLLRISMRTAAAGRAISTPLRLTFLLDSSGSMERIDRRETIVAAFELLIQQLQPQDQVTLITFARQPRLLADAVPVSQAQGLIEQVRNMASEGGTNIEAALQLAFEKAMEQKVDGAQNRIVLLTDGAVNLGNADPERLSAMVESIRSSGIAFDAAGISAEGLNDQVLEALTRKGDGRYYLLGSPQDANDLFAKQIAGAFRPTAKNVKVQVEFNPERVGRYLLLGFEKHRLNKEDFRNDSVDAAEMAAAEAGVALYQVEVNADGQGDIGSVSVRFQDLNTGQMVEQRWPIPYQADVAVSESSTASMQLATVAGLFAAKLKSDPLGEYVDLAALGELISRLPQQELSKPRVEALRAMIQQARAIAE